MSEVRKFVFVPHDTLARAEEQARPVAEQYDALDRDIQDVLNDRRISGYEKWMKYRQALSRYLQYRDSAQKPLTLDLVENKQSEEEEGSIPDPSNALESIVETVPMAHRKKARLLLQKLSAAPDFKWTPAGEVSIAGVGTIPRSNIVDLVSDAMRARKNFTPVGWKQFGDYLVRQNIPRDWIGNTARYLSPQRRVSDGEVAGPSRFTPIRRSNLRSHKLDVDSSWEEGSDND